MQINEIVSDKNFYTFVECLRSWCNNTINDRKQKEDALLSFQQEAAKFKGSNATFYRGESLAEEQYKVLKEGGEIYINPRGKLMSLSRSKKGAMPFAEFSDTGMGVLFSVNDAKVFVDVVSVANQMKKVGIPLSLDGEDYSFSDAVREREVICFSSPIAIGTKNIIRLF